MQVNGVPCTLGQNGLVFTLVNSSYVMNYGAFSACGGINTGKRSLTICAQVVNRINGKDVWFTISGSCLSQGPAPPNPLGLRTARTAYLGHGYRVMASTTVQYPGQHGTLTDPRPSTAQGRRHSELWRRLPSTDELVRVGAPVTLRDGSRVRIRQGHRADRELLLRGFERLSSESRYRRFLVPVAALTDEMVRYLTEIDHHDHEAMIASTRRRARGSGSRATCAAEIGATWPSWP